MERMTFEELCRSSEQLRDLRDQARDAARHSQREWYVEWVRRNREVLDPARAVAVDNSLDFGEVIEIVRSGLADTYRTTRDRLKRKAH
jgi:hypothetical protein